MSKPIYFAPYNVPLVDPESGLINREWYLFFQAVFNRIGGTSGASPDDLQQLAIEDMDSAGVDSQSLGRLLADVQIDALNADLPDPPSSAANDALMLLLDNQDIATGPAPPAAKVGLSTVAGSAATFMRSDAAPALSQSITPTWTGLHTHATNILINNTVSVRWNDSGGTARDVLFMFSDNNVYLDNQAGGAINFRINGFTGAHLSNAGNFSVDAPSSGGQTITATAGADLSGILINGAQNNLSLTFNNTQAGATANWRISSSATGSGFGAGNLAIGTGSSNFFTIAPSGQITFAPATGTAATVTTPDNVAAIVINDAAPVSGYYVSFQNSGAVQGAVGLGGILFGGAAVNDFGILATAKLRLGGTSIGVSGATAFTNAIGVNGNAPPAQTTGFGTPTGAAVIANFPGATATLAQCSQTIAELLAIFKSVGFLGA